MKYLPVVGLQGYGTFSVSVWKKGVKYDGVEENIVCDIFNLLFIFIIALK
jgi:hypothetical protein